SLAALVIPSLDFKSPQAAAERLLQRAAELEPDHFWAHFWLGWSYRSFSQEAAAEMTFSKCIEVRPDYGVAYAERGYGRFILKGWSLHHAETFRQQIAREMAKPLKERG